VTLLRALFRQDQQGILLEKMGLTDVRRQ
jgi:hypothetical protein